MYGVIVVMVEDGLLCLLWFFCCFQAEDGIRDLVRSRGLGDVYKRQLRRRACPARQYHCTAERDSVPSRSKRWHGTRSHVCLLYTSDAADERSSVDLGGRRIIKKKNTNKAELVCGR